MSLLMFTRHFSLNIFRWCPLVSDSLSLNVTTLDETAASYSLLGYCIVQSRLLWGDDKIELIISVSVNVLYIQGMKGWIRSDSDIFHLVCTCRCYLIPVYIRRFSCFIVQFSHGCIYSGGISRVMYLSSVRQGSYIVAILCSPLRCRYHGRASYRPRTGIAQSSL